MEAYQIRALSFTYPLREKPALKNINLIVKQGEFVTICGKSGSGKSTLLRHLKTVLTPHGTRAGEICFYGRPLAESGRRAQAARIGFVLQSPDNQIVTDKVWHELAFGLESLGFDNKTIRLRVAEMASFFGIQTWFGKDVAELSGGQKQLLNLASIMAMQPSVLVLDEPTSQLDPIAAEDFLGTVKKINRELGTAIIMTEHRLEGVLPMSDRVVVMDEGEIIVHDTPRRAGERLKEMKHDIFLAMPSPMQIYAGVDSTLPCPVTVQEGREWLDALHIDKKALREAPGAQYRREPALRTKAGALPVIQLQEVWFKYARDLPDAVKDLSLEVEGGQFYCIVGGNGTGKTTALSIVGGILKPYRGRVRINGRDLRKMSGQERTANKPALLPQNPQLLFVKKTVELDLYEMLSGKQLSKREKEQKVRDVCALAELEGLLQMHPYDLSGGEQQRAALAKVLLLEPQILLLDEPTKGLDGHFKIKLAGMLKKLTALGKTILMVSHDIEFCARYADVCALFFDGGIITQNTPRAFFSGNSFYTTAANRMARHIFPAAVTIEDVIEACRKNL
ncbi:putative HMP/thiamine import ATP-binding protein YkoD [Pelotomaculum sp. FP]|uniref:ABC transporter ATP-binding protein n=1 Tax=Pelotomaculum sp. FP TaxID=261474 RepID=UPI001065B331|nr:ATP-binding cassette domain-containing protein [Pelotomaculum sp. FP]TEB16750.1 putative HMP/thiamine import ATP-binding protein YkoD [Pelotomaculum sp. FP]